MLEIISAFREHGLDPGHLELDGKIHRFKVELNDYRKSAWYVGYQNHTLKSGETFYVVVFGNYRLGESWTYKTSGVQYTAEDRKQIKDQRARAKKSEEELREKAQLEAAEEVAKSWASLLDSGTSTYLEKKQIKFNQNLGIKFDSEGSIYAPLRDAEGKLWSWQKIQWNGEKRFYTGGRKRGCYHTLGNVDNAEQIFIVEGFATGASVYEATGNPTVISFDSGNLCEVALSIKKTWPDKPITVCGDDDKWKEKNVGREKAEEAAKKCLGRAVFPIFTNEDSKPTDWNDLHCLSGIEAVTRQLIDTEPVPKLALYALGFREGEYYFTSTQNRQVVGVSNFSEDNFLKLMPLEYWEAVFPGKTERSRVDWASAKSELISQCQKKGIFDGFNIRGAGVWVDQQRIVVNMGDHLVVDGQRMALGALKSRYFYTLGKNLGELRDDPLSSPECQTLVNACKGLSWAHPKDAGILLAGALVLSRVCGALPYRPHCWITGGAQAGKSTLFEQLIYPILGRHRLYFLGGSTEAGVRQTLKSDALPIMFDEFETNSPASAEKIAACIELLRASWSESGGSIVKGGATGNASYYQLRFSAILSSIRTRLINDADKGRCTRLELAPHGGESEQWTQLKQLLCQIDEVYGDRLFARVIKMLPILLANFKLLKTALAKRADSRFGDQYGMLLAGYSILLTDAPFEWADAEFLAETIELSDEKEIAKQADHDDALNHLLTTKIQFESEKGRDEALIEELIYLVWKSLSSPMPSAVQKNALLRIGIRVDTDCVAMVASNHAEMERSVWRGTKWSQTWGNSLARISGTEKKKIRIAKQSVRGIILPISIFDFEEKT